MSLETLWSLVIWLLSTGGPAAEVVDGASAYRVGHLDVAHARLAPRCLLSPDDDDCYFLCRILERRGRDPEAAECYGRWTAAVRGAGRQWQVDPMRWRYADRVGPAIARQCASPGACQARGRPVPASMCPAQPTPSRAPRW